MALPLERNYKLEYTRYRHYFHRLWVFYQKPVAKVSTALLLTLFTIIFFAAFAIRPTLATVAELLKKINDQEKVLNEMKQKSAALASAQQEYMTAQERIIKLNAAVPTGEEMQSLIKMLEGTAAFHQVAIDSLSLGDITYQGADEPSKAGPQTRGVSTSVTTDYQTLQDYLNDLIRIPRLVSVDSVSFAASPTQTTEVPLQMGINYTVHFLPRGDGGQP
jgi:Tfp pilus assembly protein PilO